MSIELARSIHLPRIEYPHRKLSVELSREQGEARLAAESKYFFRVDAIVQRFLTP
jgi:hypothetical protein